MLSDWTPGQLTLDANPRYFLGRPRVGRVIFKLFPDNKKAWVSLVRGQVDFVLDVDYEDYALIKDDARFKGYELPDNFCCSLVFNTRDPLFEERRIRQAVAMAIDRTDLVDTVLSGKGLAAHGPFKPGTWPYNPDPLLQAYDPGRAAKILSDLGWKDTDGDWVLDKDGRKLEFTVLDTGEDRLRGAAAKRLQWQLLQIGIRMNVAVLSLHEVRVRRIPAGDFQAVLTQFNVLPDPDRSATEVWHSASIGGRNVAGYRNPEVDRLIERGRISSDFNERKGIYREMYARISQDAPAAFLFFRKRFAAASSRLQGITDQGVSAPCGSMQDWYLK
jgi:peptide/nickel transport system substrate-binding protein